jgi:taurine transport system ATP-binding protein
MAVLFITHSVEDAVHLGTDVVVMSPRPGRILSHRRLPFARQKDARDSGTIKWLPAFVATREHVLSLLWRSADVSCVFELTIAGLLDHSTCGVTQG